MCSTPEHQIYSACWVRKLWHRPELDQVWLRIIGGHVTVWRAGYVETAIGAASAIVTHLRDCGARFSDSEFARLIDMIAEILCHVPKARRACLTDGTGDFKRPE